MSFVGGDVGNSAAINFLTGIAESGVTYPYFLPLADGDLLFYHRDRVAGNGLSYLKRFDNETDTWSDVHAPWISNEDSPNAPINYNTYPHDFGVDSNGGLHATWDLSLQR